MTTASSGRKLCTEILILIFAHCEAVFSRQFQLTSLGCYMDGVGSVRDINGLQYMNITSIGNSRIVQPLYSIMVHGDQMTHELCGSLCALGSFQFTALQAGQWCSCGNSAGSQGAAPESECILACKGNASQICGGDFRNSVFKMSYSNNCARFVPGDRSFVGIGKEDSPAYRTLSVLGLAECLYRCQAGCEALVYSQESGLCHLLEYAAVPGALYSDATGAFYVRH